MTRRHKWRIAAALALLALAIGPGAPYIGAEIVLRQHGARVQPAPHCSRCAAAGSMITS